VIYGVLAALLLFVHFTFLKFVAVGGFGMLRWRWIRWAHLPAAVLGAGLAFAGWFGPFESTERWQRDQGAQRGYSLNLIDRFLPDWMHPAALPREAEQVIGVAVVIVNILIDRRVCRRAVVPSVVLLGSSHGH
jgi:hypothetical protein